MKYSVCYIDDRIPTIDESVKEFIDNTKRLDSCALKLLLTLVAEDKWDEKEVRELIESLLSKEEFIFSVFTNPQFYFNHNQDEIYRPEIFILDWDYAGDPTDTEIYLKQLLEYSFSYISIYTRYDKQHEIESILEKAEFREVKNRVVIWQKENENSVNSLVDHILEKSSQNFSFKFGSELRKNVVNATEKILLELGGATSNDIAKYFKITEDTNKDLIDFLGERFKSHLVSSKINVLEDNLIATKDNDAKETIVQSDNINDENTNLASDLWSNRLYFYHDLQDKIVRKGDIIQMGGDYLFVISADCDLARFWAKNFGFLQYIPLYSFDKKEELSKKLTLTKKASDLKNNLSQHSLISDMTGISQGPFILPFLRINDGKSSELKNFFVFPKEITSKEIPCPDTGIDKRTLSNLPLKYEHLQDAVRIACLTEPFLTQAVEHVLNVLRGFGVPDYPPMIREVIKSKTRAIFDQ